YQQTRGEGGKASMRKKLAMPSLTVQPRTARHAGHVSLPPHASPSAIAADVRARKHASRRTIVATVVTLVVAVVVFAYVLPKIAAYGQVWEVVSGPSAWWILAVVCASALFILSDAPPWMTVLPGLGYFNALRMDLAGSALSQVLPGGAAVNAATQFAMLR